jgi:hypothetical protein
LPGGCIWLFDERFTDSPAKITVAVLAFAVRAAPATSTGSAQVHQRPEGVGGDEEHLVDGAEPQDSYAVPAREPMITSITDANWLSELLPMPFHASCGRIRGT